MPRTDKFDFTTLVLVPQEVDRHEYNSLVVSPGLLFARPQDMLRGYRFDQIVITRGVRLTIPDERELEVALKPNGRIVRL